MADKIQDALNYSSDRFKNNATTQTFSDLKDNIGNFNFDPKSSAKKAGKMLSDGAMNKINSIAINPAENFLAGKITNARQQTQGEASYGIIDNSAQILANAYVMADTAYNLLGSAYDMFIKDPTMIYQIGQEIIAELITYTTDTVLSYSDEVTAFMFQYPSILGAYTTERISYHFNSNLMTKEEIMQAILKAPKSDQEKAENDEQEKQEEEAKNVKKSTEEKLKEFTDKFNETTNKINKGMAEVMYWIEEGPDWVEKQAKNYITFGMNEVKKYVGIGVDEFDKNMKAGADALSYEIGGGLATAANAAITASCKKLNDKINKDRKKIDSQSECAKAKIAIELAGILG